MKLLKDCDDNQYPNLMGVDAGSLSNLHQEKRDEGKSLSIDHTSAHYSI